MASVSGPDAAAKFQQTREAASNYLANNIGSLSDDQYNVYDDQITALDQCLQTLVAMGVVAALGQDDLWQKVQQAADDLQKALKALDASEAAVGRALSIVQVAVLLATGVVGEDPAAIWATIKKIQALLKPADDSGGKTGSAGDAKSIIAPALTNAANQTDVLTIDTTKRDGPVLRPVTERTGDIVLTLQQQKRIDMVRKWITYWLLGLFSFVLLLGAFAAIYPMLPAGGARATVIWTQGKEFVNLSLPAVTGLLGTVIGFYFGSRAAQSNADKASA